MQYQGEGLALRSAFNRRVGRGVRLIAAAGLAFALCGGLQGCASDPAWPSLAKITDLGNIMTPEERQKAVQDLQNGGNRNSSPGSPAKPAQ